MSNKSEIQKLADAVADLTGTILDIINDKVKSSIEASTVAQTKAFPNAVGPTALDGWVMKPQVAEHFKISLRTLHTWMRKGWVPYMRTGRSVRFKLSQVDEAINRRKGIDCRW